MPPGPQTRALSPDQIRRLEKFRMAPHEGAPHGYSLPLLRTAMGAQFGWRTLKKALQGRPVLTLHHAYIVQWMDRFLPDNGRPSTAPDFKSRAAGERETDSEPVPGKGSGERNDGEEPEATGTVRGSR